MKTRQSIHFSETMRQFRYDPIHALRKVKNVCKNRSLGKIKKHAKKTRKRAKKGKIYARLIEYCLQSKQVIHLIHIGKTGGLAVKEALSPYRFFEDRAISLREHDFGFQHVPRGEKVIFFLRDPIERYKSAFFSRKRQDWPKFNNFWSIGEREAFNNFKTPDDLASALSDTNLERQHLATRAMHNIAHINTHFSDWFYSMDYFLARSSDIYFIGFQETLDEDFETLKQKLELPELCTLPRDGTKANVDPFKESRQLSDTAKQNLRNWYASDYAFLECAKRVKSLLQI
ncbi:MAG: hypothetical protein BRC49_09825 [Cyanobacteria bacterium SW_10_48_33]|nr:MAG: hypothetical protein BRC49_09825 [Cyanobacteria bacterium SW_10_48_33]